ncbi:MAG: SpoIIE family protein phosphatase [Phycisphaerales bacterium]|nr:SpoIIE family protein phosphatase [Phycisphaerales bacterium]
MTATVTTEFRHEYETRMWSWFRKRFLWWAGVVIGLSVLTVLGLGFALVMLISQAKGLGPGPIALSIISIAMSIPSLVLYTGYFLRVRSKRYTREEILRIVYILIVVTGIIGLANQPIALEVAKIIDPEWAKQIAPRRFTVGNALGGIFFTHFFACCFLPWKWTESIRPIIPLWLVSTGLTIVYGWGDWLGIALITVFSPLVAVPGALIAWARTGRFRSRFQMMVLRRHYGEMKGELTDARRIHEALLPKPINEGPVRFEYCYQPMRQIGGDHLFARLHDAGDGPVLNLVLIDVTGHGISAALTVNRLHGELERQFGEKPDTHPGAVMEGLNNYLHFSLAQHSVYATALALRIDAKARTVAWSSAGHPPAFLRNVSGAIERLESTTIVLGACRGEDFKAVEESMDMGPGDALIAYTDGATEARDIDGRMLRIEGIQGVLAHGHPEAQGGWCAAVLAEVDRFRHGPPQDDTLVVEVYCPLV